MKRIIFVALLCVTGWSFAQVKMSGVVKDSIGNPLELANVIAINQESGGLESYAITNDKGKYVLSLGKNATYKIQITAIGLKSIDEVGGPEKGKVVSKEWFLDCRTYDF